MICNITVFGYKRQRQPKMTAVVDLEEDIIYDEPSQNVTCSETVPLLFRDCSATIPRNERLLKRSILLNGMINLTGKGSRLGVIKATDADAGYSIGRLQVRRADEVSKDGFYLMHCYFTAY